MVKDQFDAVPLVHPHVQRSLTLEDAATTYTPPYPQLFAAYRRLGAIQWPPQFEEFLLF